MKRKAVFSVLALCFLIGAAGYSQDVQAEKDHPDEGSGSFFQAVGAYVGYSLPVGVRDGYFLADVYYRLSTLNGSAYAGLYTTGETLDFVLAGMYSPDSLSIVKVDENLPGFKSYRFGGEAVVHLRDQFDVGFESDLILNGTFSYDNMFSGFHVDLLVGGYWKHSVVKAVAGHPMDDFGPEIKLGISKDIGTLNLYGVIGTYGEYSFPLFVTPIYKVGFSVPVYASIEPFRALSVNGFIQMTMCDQFTSSPFLGEVLICLGVEYMFR